MIITVYISIYLYLYLYPYLYLSISISISISIYIYVYMYIYLYLYTCMYRYRYRYIYVYIYIYNLITRVLLLDTIDLGNDSISMLILIKMRILNRVACSILILLNNYSLYIAGVLLLDTYQNENFK